MKRFYLQLAVLVPALLALVPLVLYVQLGQFIRLHGDDYGHLGKALESGTWEAMRFYRENWNGDYTNFIVYGVLAPFRAAAPAFFSLVVIAAGLVGSFWFSLRLLTFLRVAGNRRLVALALASLSVVGFISGSHNVSVFYWFTGSVEHTFPVLVLMVCLALGDKTASWTANQTHRAFSVILFAALGFLNAGFSEIYVCFQLVFLALLAVCVYNIVDKSRRRTLLVLISAGLIGTVASLVVQVTSPGTAYRMTLTELWGIKVEPIRELPALIARTAETMLPYLVHTHAFAGFKMLAAAGLAVTLTLSRPARPGPTLLRRPVARWPLFIGLLVQLAFIPFLWSHTSDSPHILQRFSIQYFTVVSLNLALIIAMLAMIWQPNRFTKYLNREHGFVVYCSAVLLTIGVMFALPEIRGINERADVYFLITSYLLIGIFIWQLGFAFALKDDRQANLIGLFPLLSAGFTLASLAALIGIMLWIQGTVFDYALPSFTILFSLTALLCGTCIGALIRCAIPPAAGRPLWIRWAGLLSPIVVGLIGWNIVAHQRWMIDDLAVSAQVWDETYQKITELLDEDESAVYTHEFLFRGFHISRRYRSLFSPRRLTWKEKMYYGLDYLPKFNWE